MCDTEASGACDTAFFTIIKNMPKGRRCQGFFTPPRREISAIFSGFSPRPGAQPLAKRENGTIITLSATVSGNTAIETGDGIRNNGAIEAFSGTVNGNKATKSGGGIYNRGTLTISGKARVCGNTKDGKANNVTVYDSCAIQLTDELKDAANIGVNRVDAAMQPTKGTVAKSVSGDPGYAVTEADVAKFFADDAEKYYIKYAIRLLRKSTRAPHQT